MKHSAFTLLEKRHIPEIDGTAYYYRHNQTHARVLSVVIEDENKVFGINFPTIPSSSNGVAHILEHSVLCGSRKYPVKEPFIEMVKSSMYTFLNAMTYPDKTVYPVASTNEKDFYNLVNVYLDAVLFPLLSKETFLQEGWHYELDSPEGELTYKGVVYNEMKGAYSSPDRALYFHSRKSIFPNSIYAFDSGGDPKEIPNLTYEAFKAFHQTYYHPSNAYIFFYGDDDPLKRLDLLDEYLSQFEQKQIVTTVPLQPRFKKPVVETVPYIAPNDTDLSKKSMVTVNWLLTDSLLSKESLTLSVLDYILLGTTASPLWKALIDSGLGEDLAAHGLSGSLREFYFSVGLRGIREEDAEKVEKVIFDELNRLVKEGIPANTIAAALNTIEFSLREKNTGNTPRGLAYMSRLIDPWIHGGDPLSHLGFEKDLEALKKDLQADPRLFENFIESLFLNNPHRSRVVLVPDPEMAQREARAERERLDSIAKQLSEKERLHIFEETQRLLALQSQKDDPAALAKLPRLTLADLPRKNKELPNEVVESGAKTVLFHDIFTNEILYLTVGFDLRQIPQRLIPMLPLYTRSLLEMGTQTEDFVALSERIGRETGGISHDYNVYTHKTLPGLRGWVMLDGKVMVKQTDRLLAILQDILLSPNFKNRERFKQMLLERRSGLENAIVNSGHSMVLRRLNAHLRPAGYFRELTGGISQLLFLRDLEKRFDTEWDSIENDLQQLHQLLINRDAILLNITTDRKSWQKIQPDIMQFAQNLPQRSPQLHNWEFNLLKDNEGIVLPSKINYVGKSVNIYDSGYKFHGSALVANKLLKTGWLWNQVRVQGGAYGAFCQFNRRSGVLTMLSYRDPNHAETLNVFDQSAEFLKSISENQTEITQSIIGVIGDIDHYQLPEAKGHSAMMQYLIGEDAEALQKLRDEVLTTAPKDFLNYAEALQYFRENGIIGIAGNEKALKEFMQATGIDLKLLNIL
jgi:hypothetical protein